MIDKTAIVTGASSGMGAAISKQLLNDGYGVVGLARDFSKCTIDSENFHSISLDFSDLDNLPAQLSELSKNHPQVDVLICCAGKGQFGSIEEFSYQQLQDLMQLNFMSQAFITKALVPSMKQQGHGDIIYIGSESALSGGKKGAIYCASKFAIRGMAQALREECSRSNVRVTLINPGMTKTPFFDNLKFQPGVAKENYIEPEDIANAVSMVLASRPETVFDEINLSPMKNVIRQKPK